MGYYDIDAIETEGQRVPTQFNVSVPNLEYVSGSRDSIEAGAILELPLWISGQLARAAVDPNAGDEMFVDLEPPAAFSADVINALKSDPLAIDLAEQSPVFTHLALAWIDLFGAPDLAAVLYDAIQLRSAEIYDFAVAQRGVQPGLDESERQLYRLLHGVVRNMRNWQSGR